MRTWKLAVLVGAATAATVTGVALALEGAGARDGATKTGPSVTMVAQATDENDAAEPRAAMRELMQDPDFRADLSTLREEQQTAMRAWWDEYGDDPASDEARDALDELRDAQRTAMNDLMEKWGVELGDGPDGAALALMSNEEFRAELWKLQDDAEAAVQSWWDTYGESPDSQKAREALQTIREDQRAKLEALYEKYGVDLGDGAVMGRGGGLLGGGRLGGGPFDLGRMGHDGMGVPDGMMGPGGTDSSSTSATSSGTTL